VTTKEQIKLYSEIAWTRKWWVIVPLLLSIGVGAYLLKKLPKIYRASTTILVTRQSVPEEFVRTTVTTRVEERMASLRVQILSRTYLEKVVREFGLVSEDATDAQLERACEILSRQVALRHDRRNLSYFEIAVLDKNPERAAGVANRLAVLFIEQNTKMRSDQAAATLEQIDGWLLEKQTALDLAESRIAAYRQRHPWELPEHLHTNVQLLNAAQQRLSTLSTDILTRSQRLDTLRQEAQLAAAAGEDATSSVEDPDAIALNALDGELNQLLLDYTEEHPAVRKKRDEIADFERLHPGIRERMRAVDRTIASHSPLDSEIQRLNQEIDALEREREEILQKISMYQSRIGAVPAREQELAALSRDVDALRRDYENLSQQKQLAKRAYDMEASRKGEQFQVQDEAKVPTVPYRPDLRMILIACIAAGFGLGVAVIVVLEFFNQSVRSEEEFRSAFPDVPLLVSIAHLDSGRPRRTGKKSGKRGNTAALMWIVVLAGALLAGGRAPW
jgi:polysaccharide chain length determinant protein (PEP-CTERM system associated)